MEPLESQILTRGRAAVLCTTILNNNVFNSFLNDVIHIQI